MTHDLAFYLVGLLSLVAMAVLAAHVLIVDVRRNLPKIPAALRGEPAALGDTAPHIAAGNQRQADRADLAPTSDRIAA